jgi:DNA-binding NtrC family response regulator
VPRPPLSLGCILSMTVRAMKGRAVEFTTRPARPRDLLAAVAAVVERDRAAHRAALTADALREHSERLTPREREVMGSSPPACSTSRLRASSPLPSAPSSSTARI